MQRNKILQTYDSNVLLSSCEDFFKKYKNQFFLLAVSGGVDSVVLVSLCHALNLKFHIAHVNFQLREEESLRDEIFVESLAKSLQVPIHIQRADTASIVLEKKISIQEAARMIRYKFFEECRQKFSLDKIVTAHHFDDNIETILFRLCRGTGIKGLLGIPIENENIIRPLLNCSKKDILEYANNNKLNFVEDSSNSKDKYTRNWIRHQLVPLMEKQFPHFKENIKTHLPIWQETYHFSTEKIKRLIRKKISTTPQGERISIAFLMNSQYSNLLLLELLLCYGFNNTQMEEIKKLTIAQNGSVLKNEQFMIVKYEKNFFISPIEQQVFSPLNISQDTLQIENIFGDKLTFHYTEEMPSSIVSKDFNQVCIDLQGVQYPLIWRKYKTGDYFYPLGMKKKKKVARLLIDQKIVLSQKEKISVLEDAQKRIIWVVGLRIDERFKIKPTTTKFLKIGRTII